MSATRKFIFGIIGFIMITGVVACSNQVPPTNNDSQNKEQKLTQDYYKKQSEKVPYPLDQINDSQERRNLREKLLRFNKPDKLGYIYLITSTGEVLDFYTVKGKVSSTQSQITATDQHTYVCQKDPWRANASDTDPNNFKCDWATTPAPGDDGSYGENEAGIFWFDTNDVYHTWNGLYHYSDAPIKVDSVTHRMQGTVDGAAPSSVGENADKRVAK